MSDATPDNPSADEILALGAAIAERLTGPFATEDHGVLLYGDDGLPAESPGDPARPDPRRGPSS